MTSPHGSFDLVARAKRAMKDNGFDPDLPQGAQAEITSLPQRSAQALATGGLRDETALLWSSIDNAESRDLDQIEVAEALDGGDIRVKVGIADVDALVPKGSVVDLHASVNTTSVYTGVVVFSMLPEAFSFGDTSLNLEAARLAMVTAFTVKPDGTVTDEEVYRARVQNHGKLAYDALAAFFDENAPAPVSVSAVPGLEAQLKLQHEAAKRLKQRRHHLGALELETLEATPVAKGQEVVDLRLLKKSGSRELIEDFMIAANGVIARFLQKNGRSALARVVRTPKRWDRIVSLAQGLGTKLPAEPSSVALADFLEKQHAADPTHFADLSLSVVKLLGPGEYVLEPAGRPSPGHFGLATQDYTHSTAPNRRYADLITQRLLKATLEKKPAPYSDGELDAVAQHCTQKESDERKVERLMRKVSAALLLAPRVGETFDAIVTGVSDKGTFVRLLHPPAEGRVVKGERGLDVGDACKVRLTATDPEKGFIDLAR